MAGEGGVSRVDRRTVLKGAAVAGGAVWVGPVVDSMITPASAASGQPTDPCVGSSMSLATCASGPCPGTNVTGDTQTVYATVLDSHGNGIPGITVNFSVTGANPGTGSGVTAGNGVATFTYSGTQPGTDNITATASCNGHALQAGPVTVTWSSALAAVSTSIMLGSFWPNPSGTGVFGDAFNGGNGPDGPPAFTQFFPTINFNAPTNQVPGSGSDNVGDTSVPFINVTTDVSGNYTGVIPAEQLTSAGAVGPQAGVDPSASGDFRNFFAAFTGQLFIKSDNTMVTFDFFSDDGSFFGFGPEQTSGATASIQPGGSEDDANLPPATFVKGYPVLGGQNQGQAPTGYTGVVLFPKAGVYPYEMDYCEGLEGQLAFTVQVDNVNLPPRNDLALSPSSVSDGNTDRSASNVTGLTPFQEALGSGVAFTMTATDGAGNALTNTALQLVVKGANPQTISGTTNNTGVATFTYTGTNPGHDFVQGQLATGPQDGISNMTLLNWS